jgi:hypothetical protein
VRLFALFSVIVDIISAYLFGVVMKRYFLLCIILFFICLNNIVYSQQLLSLSTKTINFGIVETWTSKDTILICKNISKSKLIIKINTNCLGPFCCNSSSFTLESDSIEILTFRYGPWDERYDSNFKYDRCDFFITCYSSKENAFQYDTIYLSGIPADNAQIGFGKIGESLDFKEREILKTYDSTIFISNSHLLDLHDTIIIDGQNKDEFSLDSFKMSDTITIFSRGIKYFNIHFSPKSEGKKSAFLTHCSNSREFSPITFELNGYGIISTSVKTNNFLYNKIFISPNPAAEYLELKLPTDYENSSITIFNSLGVEVYSQSISTTSVNINTKQFPAGIYYCIVKTGKEALSGKFVVVK